MRESKISGRIGNTNFFGILEFIEIRAIPSVVSFGLTIFRVSFCTYEKFYIDSDSFLMHVLMFGCICFKWRDKLVVFAQLVLNSWWQCVHFELLLTFFLCMISFALLPAYFLLPQLHSHYHSTFFLKSFNLY